MVYLRNHTPGRLPTWLLTAIIILIGVGVRFMQMGLIRYGYDQSYPAYQATGLLDGGIWPVIGQPSSVFLDNPALMPYVQALPLLLFRDPLAVQALILILNSAAVWFVWRIATELLGRRGGWIAAFLFAVSPWVVFFSRTTWVQSLVPFFMAVIAWGLWPTFAGKSASPFGFFAGAVAITLLSQTYIQAWGILPQVVLLLIIFRRRVPRKPLLAGTAVFVAATGVYLYGLATRPEVNTLKASGFLAEGWQGVTDIGFRHAARFVNSIDFRPAYAAGNPAGPIWPAVSNIAVILLSLSLLVGVLRAVFALRRPGEERHLAVIMLIWFFIPVLMTSVQGTYDIHPHYLMLTLPAGHILAAWAIVPHLRYKIGPIFVATTIILVGLVFAHDLYRANELVDRYPVWPEFDGWSLEAGSDVGRAMRELLVGEPGPFPRRIVAAGDKSLMSGLSATFVKPIGGIDYPDFTVHSPAQSLIYVIEGGEAPPSWLRDFIDMEEARSLEFAGGTKIIVARSKPDAAASIANFPQTPVQWSSEAGITLLGYTLDGPVVPGGLIDIVTYWRVDELKPEQAEWYVAPSYQLIDLNGNKVSNVGGHGQWAYRWELGDVYIEHVLVPIPEKTDSGSYSLEINLFDSVHQRPYTLFDGQTPVAAYPIAIELKPE